jgi:hypothetical protein
MMIIFQILGIIILKFMLQHNKLEINHGLIIYDFECT